MTSFDTVTKWREDWSSASVINHTIVTDPTIQQPGFDLPRHTFCLLNHFHAGQGPCHAKLRKYLHVTDQEPHGYYPVLLRLLRAFIECKIAQGPQMRYVGRNSSMVA